ncbi:hypothetical protein B0H19DRAFT_1131781 [Mycena capillaripes]|nr:hypothetical protein B0H19DRAFT_1131781 [Mycena capillaripes]
MLADDFGWSAGLALHDLDWSAELAVPECTTEGYAYDNNADALSANETDATPSLAVRKMEADMDEAKESGLFAKAFHGVARDDFFLEGDLSSLEKYTLHEACNPCISIEGMGQIGTPLGEAAARAIVSLASPVVLPASRDAKSHVWEVLAEKIHFDNPEWDIFQRRVGLSACKSLTGTEDVGPTFRFSRLLLQETGSEMVRQEGRKSVKQLDPFFGTLIIILPSLFSGGTLRLRNDTLSNTYDLALGSGLTTSVLAVRDIADCELDAVTFGYRLSLVYDILQPNTAIGRMPRFPNFYGASDRMKAILRSWKQETSVNHLEYLLQHRYPYKSDLNVDPRFLIGADALLVFHLQRIVEDLGLELYFAHFSFTTHALEDFDVPSSNDSNDVLRRKVGDGKNTKPEFDYTLVDLDGKLMTEDDLDFSYFAQRLVDNEPLGNIVPKKYSDSALTLETITTHERVMLLILDPNRPGVAVRCASENSCDSPCNILDNSLSVYPTDEETLAAMTLITDCELKLIHQNQWARIITSILSIASRWGDATPLLRILQACNVDKRIDRIGPKRLASACAKFGWTKFSAFLEKAVQKDTSNSRRLELLNELRKMANKNEDSALNHWCDGQEDILLRSLRSVAADEIEPIFDTTISRGWNRLKEIVFPQICSQNVGDNIWALMLQNIESIRDVNISEGLLIPGLVTECVTQIIDCLPTFPTRKMGSEKPSKEVPKEVDLDRIMDVIRLCTNTNNSELCGRVVPIVNLAFTGSRYLLSPWMHYAKLCRELEAHLQSNETPFAVLRPFFIDAIDALFVHAAEFGLSDAHTVDLSALFVSLRCGGGISFLKDRILIHHDLFKTYPCTTSTFIGNLLIEKLKPPPQDVRANSHYSQSLSTIAGCALEAVKLAALYPDGGGHEKPVSSSVIENLVEILKLYIEARDRIRYVDLLSRLLPPPPRVSTIQHLLMFHAQFLPLLHKLLLKQTAQLQQEFRPITEPFLAIVIKIFANRVMYQKLEDRLGVGSIGCTCNDCSDLRNSFSKDRLFFSIQRSEIVINHLHAEVLKTKIHRLPGVQVEKHCVNKGAFKIQVL